MTETPKKLVLLTLILACSVSAIPAFAQDRAPHEGYFNVRSATTVLSNGVHELDARLQLLLSDEANAALTSGVQRQHASAG